MLFLFHRIKDKEKNKTQQKQKGADYNEKDKHDRHGTQQHLGWQGKSLYPTRCKGKGYEDTSSFLLEVSQEKKAS